MWALRARSTPTMTIPSFNAMSEREAQFEKMLAFVQQKYADTVEKMERLKAENKTKSATFRQLMGDKLTYQNILTLYRLYGLLDES